MPVREFISNYFIEPIVNNTGYNIVNTTVYAIILVTAVYILFRFMKKFKFKFDKNLLYSLLSFTLFAAIFHTLSDSGAISRNFWTVSPGIWISVGVPIILVIFLSKKFEKKIGHPYYKISISIGLILAFLSLIFYSISDWNAVFLVISFNLLIIIPTIYVLRKLKIYKNDMWVHAVSLQLLDGATSFTTLQFYPNYFEQHVLGNFFINIFGPIGIVIMKLVVILPILYLIEKDEKTRDFLFIIVAILGAAPGIRSALRLFAGV